MMISKREQGRMERRLIASLTHACEDAKPLLPGFCWLTHSVDYQHFPDSLVVTWVFDNDANLASALKSDAEQRIHQLTADALDEAGVDVTDIARHVDLDSEEACQRVHGGNWERRLEARPVKH
nr:hypothetical protein [Marinobacter bohaiensis]